MNFNFNFKDIPFAPGQSIRRVTNVRDPHHTGKCGIKRGLIVLLPGVPLLASFARSGLVAPATQSILRRTPHGVLYGGDSHYSCRSLLGGVRNSGMGDWRHCRIDRLFGGAGPLPKSVRGWVSRYVWRLHRVFFGLDLYSTGASLDRSRPRGSPAIRS